MFRKCVTALLIAVFMVTNTGCYGSFSLTKKVYDFNGSLGDKWIQSAAMWAMLIIPVYEVAGIADLIILNLLEFWTGNNPVAVMEEETIEKTVEKNGEMYRVTIGQGSVTVNKLTGTDAGKFATLSFNNKTSTCSLSNGVEHHVLCTIHPKPLNTVDLHYPDGSIRTYHTNAYEEIALLN